MFPASSKPHGNQACAYVWHDALWRTCAGSGGNECQQLLADNKRGGNKCSWTRQCAFFYLSASTSHCKFLTSKTPVCDPVCKMLWNITCGKGLPAPPPLNCLCWHFYAHTPRQTLHLVSRLDLEDETRNLLFPVRFISSSRWDVTAFPKYCFHRLSFMEAIIVLNVCHWFSRFSKVRVVSLIPMLVSDVQ